MSFLQTNYRIKGLDETIVVYCRDVSQMVRRRVCQCSSWTTCLS